VDCETGLDSERADIQRHKVMKKINSMINIQRGLPIVLLSIVAIMRTSVIYKACICQEVGVYFYAAVQLT
jgi:hypothetical protein